MACRWEGRRSRHLAFSKHSVVLPTPHWHVKAMIYLQLDRFLQGLGAARSVQQPVKGNQWELSLGSALLHFPPWPLYLCKECNPLCHHPRESHHSSWTVEGDINNWSYRNSFHGSVGEIKWNKINNKVKEIKANKILQLSPISSLLMQNGAWALLALSTGCIATFSSS